MIAPSYLKLILISFSGYLLFLSCDREKFGFVNTEALVGKYYGAIDLERKIQLKTNNYYRERDSLYALMKKEVQTFQTQYPNAQTQNAKAHYDRLADRSQKVNDYLKSKEELLSQENNTKMDSLTRFIKNFIENYGKQHSYTFIFGQNVLYNVHSKDLTDEIAELLNNEYLKSGKTPAPAAPAEAKKDSL